MIRRLMLYIPLNLVLGYVCVVAFTQEGKSITANPKLVARRGVSLAGAEFGVERIGFSNRRPGVVGRDYLYNGPKTYEHFAQQGVDLYRIPLRWERLQPRLGEALDPAELGRLQNAVARAKKNGGEVIIDIHNYGRYTLELNGMTYPCIIDEQIGGTVPVTSGHFADLWQRLALAFRDESGVYAYGLMNEPHDMGRSDWKAISQGAVNAIRATGDRKLILVAGNRWSNAEEFSKENGTPWISDAANNFAYEAHCYFDRDNSGKYRMSYDAELKADADLEERGVRRLEPFHKWCKTHNVQGFLGEFGVPRNDPRWMNVLNKFISRLETAGMGGCIWAGGEWWHDAPLSVHPDRTGAAAPQMQAWAKNVR